MDTKKIRELLGTTRVVDDDGLPLVVYRGERVPVLQDDGLLQTLHGSLSFCTAEAASFYAQKAIPGEGEVAPVVVPALLRIEKPLLHDPEDPFIGLDVVRATLGDDQVDRIARKFARHIESTLRWKDGPGTAFGSVEDFLDSGVEGIDEILDEMYFDASRMMDDPVEVALLKAAGFDGAIFGGSGENALDPEYRVFDERQVVPLLTLGRDAPSARPQAEEDTEAESTSAADFDAVKAGAAAVQRVRGALEQLLGARAVTLAEDLGRLVVTTAREISVPGYYQIGRGALASIAKNEGFQRMLAEQRAARQRAIAAVGVVEDCAIVAHAKRENTWQMILRDASEPGKWRTQSFDLKGFSGHMVYDTKEQAIESAATSGFTVRDDAALDRIQDTPSFQRGLYVSDLIRRVNMSQLSMNAADRMLAEYDQAAAALASIAEMGAQAFIAAGGRTIYLLADRVQPGKEAAVFMHEIVHRHGRNVLGRTGWNHLVGTVKGWSARPEKSIERRIFDAAYLRATDAAMRSDGLDRALYDEELFCYAVEEAVSRGVKPNAEAHLDSAPQWLDSVVATLRAVVNEIVVEGQAPELDAQDVVDLAYAMAQLENPERTARILNAMQPHEKEFLQGVIDRGGAPTWYSQLEMRARLHSRSVMTAGEWLTWLKEQVGEAITADDLERSGVCDWLEAMESPEKEVRRAEIIDSLRSCGVFVPMCSMPSIDEDLLRAVNQYAVGSPESLESAQAQCAAVVAKYIGTDQWMRAPNGAPTQLTQRQWITVRTENFKGWFGDWEADPQNASSAINADTGEPLVLFHGSNEAGFAEFNPEKGTGLQAIFFASKYETAASYSARRRQAEITADEGGEYDPEPGIYEVFLNIRKPRECFFEGAHWDGTRMGQWVVDAPDGEPIYSEAGDRYFYSHEEAQKLAEKHPGATVEDAPADFYNTNAAVRDGKREGADGVIIRDVTDPGHHADWVEHCDVYAVFSGRQIKSATDNVGSFNPAIWDIRYSLAQSAQERRDPPGAVRE